MMDDSVLRILVVPTCLGVLAGLVVGFISFQLIESVAWLFQRIGSGPTVGAAAARGSCDAPRCDPGAGV